MTLRTFFKNLFAPDSEAKPLYTPLDLRLLEHYEAWQKNREEGKRKNELKEVNCIKSSFKIMTVRTHGKKRIGGSLTSSSPRARACAQQPLRTTTNG